MRRLLKSKKGILGLDTAKSFVIAILGLVIIGVVSLIILDALRDSATTATQQDVDNIINNTSKGLSSFFSDVGTWFTLIGVVIIILIVAVVIVVINRFGSPGAGAGL